VAVVAVLFWFVFVTAGGVLLGWTA
jgi:hypothetical protein